MKYKARTWVKTNFGDIGRIMFVDTDAQQYSIVIPDIGDPGRCRWFFESEVTEVTWTPREPNDHSDL